MMIRKNNQLNFHESSLRRFRGLLLCLCFLFFASGKLLAQENLSQYESLYEGCVDNEESIIFGEKRGPEVPNPWPRNLNSPVFPGGGDIQLTRFVHSNIEYPDVVDFDTRKRIKGIVYVQVVIDRCGRPTNPRIVSAEAVDTVGVKKKVKYSWKDVDGNDVWIDYLYDKEALRIMNGLPVFKPGSVNGERVKVALMIPVHFLRDNLPPKKKYNYRDIDDYEEFDYDSIDW